MEFKIIDPAEDLSMVVNVLNTSHDTVAKEFGFTRETNPSNNAFIDETSLRAQLEKGIKVYSMTVDAKMTGCIAIEKSVTEDDVFYIEKVSVMPNFRGRGYGRALMDFAIKEIVRDGGRQVSIALIDSNKKLKQWYLNQGFQETGIKDFAHLPFRVCFMRKELPL
jgi:ribosomal protein S18 acetylase RimI-like enzyme